MSFRLFFPFFFFYIYKLISIYYGLLMTKCPELEIKTGSPVVPELHRGGGDTVQLHWLFFFPLHSHIAYPFLICWLATLPLQLCLSHWLSMALNFILSLAPLYLFLIFLQCFWYLFFCDVGIARKFLLRWCSLLLEDHRCRWNWGEKKSNRNTLFLAQSDYFTVYLSWWSA